MSDFDVTVAAWERVDPGPIKRDYDVDLALDRIRIHYPARLWAFLLRLSGFRGALLQRYVLLRHARRVAAQYDVVVSFNNEIDAGDVPTVQYIHYPWGIWPRPEVELRLIHRVPGLLRAYYAFGRALSPVSRDQIACNVTLVNSDWTGEQFRACYGGETTTVYPPLMSAGTAAVPPEREEAILALGTFAPHKRAELIIEIVERVRGAGNPVQLWIAGSRDPHHAAYSRRVIRMASQRSWITLFEGPSRAEVDDLLSRARYGLHAMADEHFGMSIAEMTAHGCIPFVPSAGGQVEVVSRRAELLYETAAEAATKLCRVINDRQLQQTLSAELKAESSRFSRDLFRATIRTIVNAAAGLSR
jgi:glycosyltransferase involved in cell wall biosynthesis